MQHLPMQHVQGYTGSHWTPPSGNYSLRIALAVGGRQGDSKQNKDVLCTHFDGHFDGHRNAVVLYRVHHPMEEFQGFHISH
jgi:hypothetical protein